MLRTVVAVLVAVCALQSQAQVTGSATFVSDYRFRGVSLSDDRPAAQLAIDYDLPASGWYAGGMLSSARLDATHTVQLLAYGGHAWRISPNLSWETGVRYTRFTGHDSYAYGEAYVGVAFKQLVGRVYYAPNYFNANYPVWYAELNDSHALFGNWYAFAHAGYLRRNGSVEEYHTSRFRSDVRAGIGYALDPWNFQLSWATARGAPDVVFGYPEAMNVTRDAWMLSVSYAW